VSVFGVLFPLFLLNIMMRSSPAFLRKKNSFPTQQMFHILDIFVHVND
jgi:hypothetical protein